MNIPCCLQVTNIQDSSTAGLSILNTFLPSSISESLQIQDHDYMYLDP